MAQRHSGSPAEAREQAERAFWSAAFLAAEVPTLLRGTSVVAPEGAAQLAAEYADASLAEYKRRFK